MLKYHHVIPIAYCHSPFKQKFGVPHQSGLTPSIESRIQLEKEFAQPGVFKGLEAASHVWLLFIFHQSCNDGWKPTVKPPRQDTRLGVFASRSPHRPNAIGQSLVKIISIHQQGDDIHLIVSGADLVDGTPIIDIKPYLPQSESKVDATFKRESRHYKTINEVCFEPQAATVAKRYQVDNGIDLTSAIEEVLLNDPRPRQFRNDCEREFAFGLYHTDITWRAEGELARVLTIDPL